MRSSTTTLGVGRSTSDGRGSGSLRFCGWRVFCGVGGVAAAAAPRVRVLRGGGGRACALNRMARSWGCPFRVNDYELASKLGGAAGASRPWALRFWLPHGSLSAGMAGQGGDASSASVLLELAQFIAWTMGGKVWGGYQPLEGVTIYVRFCFLGPCGCPRPWQRKCACAWAYGHPSGPRQLFFCAQAQNWPSTTAKRLAILVDARKSKRQREGSLSELNPPALEPRDG